MLMKSSYDAYLNILREELIPATGCTEPIAIASCAAMVREVLGARPEKIQAEVSGNIVKNVKSVIVPNTRGMKGISAAIAAGIVAGRAEAGLQVISRVTEKQKDDMTEYLKCTSISVACKETPYLLDICITGFTGSHSASVRIANHHTNIVFVKKDDVVLENHTDKAGNSDKSEDRRILNIVDIVEFADTVPVNLLYPLIEPQIRLNTAIAEEGLRRKWGAQIGRTLLDNIDMDIKEEARAWAAAGSDARMSGCEMPVIILSGSGNQGIAASLPVIRYARLIEADEERLIRALALSDLVTLHQKTGIGRLSAYCGAISAGVGAGAGIAYLLGADTKGISYTVSNAVAILSGTICDGAKPSCAAKISEAVDAGITGYRMYLRNNNFKDGEGIVGSDVEDVISHVGILASKGMAETDRVILGIMTSCTL